MTAGIRGVVPIVAVPFAADGSLLPGELAAEVAWLASLGADGFGVAVASELFVLGDDWAPVVATMVGAADGLPVVASVGLDDAAATVARARRAAELGASAVMAFPPRRRQLGIDDLLDFYASVASAGLPVWVQDAPQLTGVELPIDAVRAVATVPGVTGWKVEAHPTTEKIAAVRDVVGRDATILGGAGGFSFPAELAASAEGTMPGATACARMVETWRRHLAGDSAGAAASHAADAAVWSFAREHVQAFVHMQKLGLVAAGIFSTDACRLPGARLGGEEASTWLRLLAGGGPAGAGWLGAPGAVGVGREVRS